MADQLNPEYVAWCRRMFDLMAEGGTWGIPSCGLVFRRFGNEFHLIDRMPHDPAMPITAEQLRRQQDREFALNKRYFEAAGITVRDMTAQKFAIDKSRPN